MRLIKATIDSVPANPLRSWDSRIVLGIWAVKFLPLCQTYLPSFPISHIGFSTCYARQFLKVENCSFNMLQKVLLGPIGANFIKDVRKAGRQLFVWTVNDENLMKWSIQRYVDGVITDDPKKFKEVCDNYDGHEPTANPGVYQLLLVPYSYCFHSYRWYRRVVLTNPGRYTFWLVPQSKAHESESPVADTSQALYHDWYFLVYVQQTLPRDGRKVAQDEGSEEASHTETGGIRLDSICNFRRTT
jgi:hypothetical protein